ncbi:hypothetical protein JVU11DRAFT_7752 [Chiua virens]|nr:hypothetical protein JVU11DRAFT_7752 [Chiua virens]
MLLIQVSSLLAAELVSPGPAGLFTAVRAVAAVADLSIAAGLTVLLMRSRERALKRSRSILHKLLVLTINNGIWTALFAVFAFVAILAFKNTLIYAALYFPLCPLYCNTVLANLNARDFLKARSAVTECGTMDTSYNLGSVLVHPRSTVGTHSADPVLTVQVEVNKTVHRGDDELVLRGRASKFDLEDPEIINIAT